MASNDHYVVPFDTDAQMVDFTRDSAVDPDVVAAREAWLQDELRGDESDGADPSVEFVGRWNHLVSQTNWAKGGIIGQWRQSLIDSGAVVTDYSDEAWAGRVGGVTASHVGRLRRVFDRFGDQYETYPQLSWTHFLVAMEWDDAAMWLQGASDGRWSVSVMRRGRWEAGGGDPNEQPRDSDVMTTDVDEDYVQPSATRGDMPATTQPAQGGGSTKTYGDEPANVSAGRGSEGPDFGDEESLNQFSTSEPAAIQAEQDDASNGSLVQPFAGLDALPDDLADAVEMLKLGIVRHKATGWEAVSPDTIRAYMTAFLVLIEARSR